MILIKNKMTLDRIDKKILEVLQINCQISNQELAERVALSPSSCLRRVGLLMDQGYIKKQVALLEPAKLGLRAFHHLSFQ